MFFSVYVRTMGTCELQLMYGGQRTALLIGPCLPPCFETGV